MLIINKSESITKLIVTVSEINVVTTGSTIELFNQYTNVNNSFNLPVDSSNYLERFNQFNLNTSIFSGLTVGTYTYTIKDSTSSCTETGLLKVVDDVLTVQEQIDENFIYIEPSSTDDDFIIYQP